MQQYIFAFGSLINQQTHGLKVKKAIPAYLEGYQRGWFTRIESKKVTALGIHKRAKAITNGLLLEVTPENIVKFDKRELSVGHKRELVTQTFIKPYISGQNIGGEIFIYTTPKQKTANNDYPLIQSYLDMVLLGCFEIGEKFTLDFIIQTMAWKYPWLNDRSNPIYPRYIKHSKNKIIDSFLKKHIPFVVENRVD